MSRTELSSRESAEILVTRAFAPGFHFAFRRPTPQRPKTRLFLMPPAQCLFTPWPDEERQLYGTLLSEAEAVARYLMDFKSMTDLPRHWQVHYAPSPRRKQLASSATLEDRPMQESPPFLTIPNAESGQVEHRLR